jgi:hypothetical protein
MDWLREFLGERGIRFDFEMLDEFDPLLDRKMRGADSNPASDPAAERERQLNAPARHHRGLRRWRRETRRAFRR